MSAVSVHLTSEFDCSDPTCSCRHSQSTRKPTAPLPAACDKFCRCWAGVLEAAVAVVCEMQRVLGVLFPGNSELNWRGKRVPRLPVIAVVSVVAAARRLRQIRSLWAQESVPAAAAGC